MQVERWKTVAGPTPMHCRCDFRIARCTMQVQTKAKKQEKEQANNGLPLMQ